MSSKIGRLAAKLLGIELIPSDPTPTSHKRDAYEHVDYYLEPEPTLGDWVREHTPSGRAVRHYFYHMFPFWQWIWSYNMQWFIGDMIAGKCSSWPTTKVGKPDRWWFQVSLSVR